MLGTWTFVIGLTVFGFVLLLVELFVIPGFGVAGIAGMFAILGAVSYASYTLGIGYAIIIFIVAFTLSIIALIKATSGGTLARLKNPAISPGKVVDDEGQPESPPPVGARGVSITRLRPAGMVQIEGRRYDVIADGPMAEIGQAVEVVEIIGTVVKVRSV